MTSLVLIVEDDPIIAWDLENLAHEAGADVRSCASVRDALCHLNGDFSAALLDIDVLDGKTYPIARQLQKQQVRVVFISATRMKDIPPEFSDVPLIAKPFRPADVLSTLKAVMA